MLNAVLLLGIVLRSLWKQLRCVKSFPRGRSAFGTALNWVRVCDAVRGAT